jgi:Flp pilus assembly protein TadD
MRIVPLLLALTTLVAGSAASATRDTSWATDASIWNQRRLYLQAVQAMELGHYADAARMFDRLNLLPDARLYHPAAIAHLRAGNLAGAEVNFLNALLFDPRSARAQMGLGVVYVQQGKRPDAEELLRTLQKRQRRCASACERADEINHAVKVLSTALS